MLPEISYVAMLAYGVKKKKIICLHVISVFVELLMN